MTIGDMPSMQATASTSSAYWGNDFSMANNAVDPLAHIRRVQLAELKPTTPLPVNLLVGAYMNERRVVQVFIADPNENVPLDDCLLFKGEEKLTDATDQELFLELDIKNLLEKHNLKRTKVVDKKVKDRTEHLEPAKVRDLKMVVVTVAKL